MTWRLSEVLHVTVVSARFWVLASLLQGAIAKGSCGQTVGSGGSPVRPSAFACSAVTAHAVNMATGGCMIERHHFRGRGISQTVCIVEEIYFAFPLKNPG